MSYADVVGRSARRVLIAQVLATVVVAAIFGAAGNRLQLAAAAYGGAVTMAITAWLAWRTARADTLEAIYTGALARYAMAMAAVALGFVVLKLPPLPLLCGFAVTQFGFLILLRRPRGNGE